MTCYLKASQMKFVNDGHGVVRELKICRFVTKSKYIRRQLPFWVLISIFHALFIPVYTCLYLFIRIFYRTTCSS